LFKQFTKEEEALYKEEKVMLLSSRFLLSFYQVYDMESNRIALSGPYSEHYDLVPPISLNWFSIGLYDPIALTEVLISILATLFLPLIAFLLFYRYYN
jgi:hypothetical protein